MMVCQFIDENAGDFEAAPSKYGGEGKYVWACGKVGTITQYRLEKCLRFTAELLETVSPTGLGRWRIPQDTSNQAPDGDDDSNDDDDDDDSDGDDDDSDDDDNDDDDDDDNVDNGVHTHVKEAQEKMFSLFFIL